MVEKDQWGYPSVEREMETYLAEKNKFPYAGIVHRIDRPVSGVLLLAKKKSVLRKLNDQFREKEVKKKYYAIVADRPVQQKHTLIHFLERDEKNKYALVFKRMAKGRVYCELNYNVEAEKENKFLLEVEPVTGKFHQIRAQLAFVGCPIIGDAAYGSNIKYAENAICLHAYSIEFMHPVSNKVVSVKCTFPKEKYWDIFKSD